MNLGKLVVLISKLPYADKEALFEALSEMVKPYSGDIMDSVKEIREPHCPYCKKQNIIGHGKYRGRQRYKCKDCKKTFNDFTASPLAGTHYPDKWAEHITLVLNGASLKRVASELDIHVSTAFYWRHKVMSTLCAVEPDVLQGIIESDGKLFLESSKGKNQVRKYGHRAPRKRGGKASKRGVSNEQVCVLVAIDRTGAIVSKTAGLGDVSTEEIKAVIGKYVPKKAVFCSDGVPAYGAFAREWDLTHYKLNATKKKRVIEKVYHIQHVNSYHSRMELLINNYFRGVSSRHLDKYLAWQRFMEMHRNTDKCALKEELLKTVFRPEYFSTVKTLRVA